MPSLSRLVTAGFLRAGRSARDGVGTVRPLTFVRGFLQRPREVASIAPSSSVLLRKLTALDGLSDATTVVELGPGTGGTTSAILEGMNPSSRLLCVEINPTFVTALRGLDDPRLDVHRGDAANLPAILRDRRYPPPQVVISGVPFSTMPREQGQSLVAAICQALAPGGVFVAYQLSPCVRHLADPLFGPRETSYVLWNIPPLRIDCWAKRGEGCGEPRADR